MPELAPDEALVAVMASAMNYNTVWSARFEPIPTFVFLDQLGRAGRLERAPRPGPPRARIGRGRRRRPRRRRPCAAGGRGPRRHLPRLGRRPKRRRPTRTRARARAARAWGFETNFGGLAHYAIVKGTPADAEAGAPDVGGGGLQHALRDDLLPDAGQPQRRPLQAGRHRLRLGRRRRPRQPTRSSWSATAAGSPSASSTRRRRQRLLEELGCDLVIRRDEMGLDGARSRARSAGKRDRRGGPRPSSARTRTSSSSTSARATFWASVFMVRRGGTVVTCGSSTGYEHSFDNRYLWMHVKRIIGSHAREPAGGAGVQPAVRAGHAPAGAVQGLRAGRGRRGRPAAADQPPHRQGRRCSAWRPEEGLGVEDPERRAEIGEDEMEMFRKYA